MGSSQSFECANCFHSYDRLELYAEVHDLQDANRIGPVPKQRELTADFGGRQSLTLSNKIRLQFMGGAPFKR